MRSVGSATVSDRVWRQLQQDIAQYGRAILVRRFFRWRRLHPARAILLNAVFTQEAVTAAKADGSLVEEVAA